METTHYNRIIEHRDKFIGRYANKKTEPVYMHSPSVFLAFFDKDTFTEDIKNKIYNVISNSEALNLIDCSRLTEKSIINEIKKAVKFFYDNAGSFSNMNKINVFMAGTLCCMKNFDLEKLIADISSICDGNQECNIIYILDELSAENRTDVVNAINNLKNYTEHNKVFVMGRKKLNGKVPGIEAATKDYLNIICELVLNTNGIILPNGAYSAGYASIGDMIGAFWSSTLSKCDSTYEEDEAKGKKDSIIDEIDQCIADEYKNFQIFDLNGVIKNSVGGINPTADIEDVVRAVYGDSLYVYLEQQKKALLGIIEEKIEEIASIIYSGTDAAVNDLKKAIEIRLENSQTSYKPSNVDYGFMISESVSGVERYIIDKFLTKEIEKLKNTYTEKILERIIEIINNYFSSKEDIQIKLYDEKKAVDSYIANFNNTSFNISGVYLGKLDYTAQASYIDQFCESVTKALIDNNDVCNFLEKETGNALSYLCNMAQPYCVNSGFNINKNLFLIGNSDFSKLIADYDNSIIKIGNSHCDFDAVLNYTSIDLAEYSDFLS